jgi:hypothetical protein
VISLSQSHDNTINLLYRSCQNGDKDAARLFLNSANDDIKKGIFREVCVLSDVDTSNSQWAEEHTFDDVKKLSCAIERVVKNTLLDLSKERQDTTYGHVYRLANVSTSDLKWGEHHAFDDVARLATALYAAGVLSDSENVCNIVFQNQKLIQYIRSKDVILSILIRLGCALEHVIEPLKNDREVVLAAVSQEGRALAFANVTLQNNKEVVLAAVSKDGTALEYASEALKNDKEVALVALSQNGYAFELISRDLQQNKEFILNVVSQDGLALEFITNSLRRDKNILLKAVSQNGMALLLVSDAMRNDKDIVLAAVSQNGMALEHASDTLKKDWEVVLKAISKSAFAIRFAIIDGRDFFLEAVSQNGLSLQFASDALKNDKEVVLTAVSQNGLSLRYANDALKNNKEVVLTAVSQNGLSLRYANDALKNNKESLFRLCCDAFLNNKSFFSQAAPSNLITEELKQEIYQRLVQQHIEKLPPHSLLDHLKTELLDCKNEELKCFFIYAFIHVSQEHLNDYFSSKDFTLSQKQDVIIPLVVIASLDATDKIKDGLIASLKSHYKALFKDVLKRQILLQLFQSVSGLQAPNKYAPIAFVMENNKGKALMNCIHMLKAIAVFAPQKWSLLPNENLNLSDLATLLLGDLQARKIIPDSADAVVRAASIFLTYRMPGAFLSYASKFLNDPLMSETLLKFTTGVIEERFQQDRNLANSHSIYLTKEQRINWHTSLPQKLATRNDSSAPFDIGHFLHEKLILDNHGGEFLAAIIPYLRKEIADTSSFNDLQKMVIGLLAKDSNDLPKALQDLELALEDPQYERLEFKNDVRGALLQLQGVKGSLKNTLVDSDDAEDFLLCGTEITGSCQRVDGNPNLNKCLMGYALDGKVRLLAVKNSHGTILARAILKILIDDHNQPVLFFERVYGDQNYTKALKIFATKKAETVGIPLYEVGRDHILRSFGNVAPFEYEDGGVGVSTGIYHVNASLLQEQYAMKKV